MSHLRLPLVLLFLPVLAGCTTPWVIKDRSEPIWGYICGDKPSLSIQHLTTENRTQELFKPDLKDCPKSNENRKVIVFVHGLGGDSVGTWYNESSDAFWPRLMRDDKRFEKFDIFSYGYRTDLVADVPEIPDIAANMQNVLDSSGVMQHDEIYFVVHSLGGIVTRAYLLRAAAVMPKVKLVHFFGTPGDGSGLADLLSVMLPKANPQDEALRIMRSGSYLAEQLNQWRSLTDRSTVTACSCESDAIPGLGIFVVPYGSCALMCDTSVHSVRGNHFEIVKPKDQKAEPYQALFGQVTRLAAPVSKPDPFQALMGVLERIRKEVEALQQDRPVEDKQTGKTVVTEEVTIDLSGPTEVQIYLRTSDSFRIKNFKELAYTPRYVDARGKLQDFEKQAAGDDPVFFVPKSESGFVMPLFYQADKPEVEAKSGKIQLLVMKSEYLFAARGTGTAKITTEKDRQPKYPECAASSEIPPCSGHAKQPGPPPVVESDLCDLLQSSPSQWSCQRTRSGRFLVRMAQPFYSGRWEAAGLDAAARTLNAAVSAAGLALNANIRGYASNANISCKKLASRARTSWPGTTDSLPECAYKDDANGNQILSYGRALAVAKALKSDSIVIKDITPLGCGSSYSATGNRIADRAVTVELTPVGQPTQKPVFPKCFSATSKTF